MSWVDRSNTVSYRSTISDSPKRSVAASLGPRLPLVLVTTATEPLTADRTWHPCSPRSTRVTMSSAVVFQGRAPSPMSFIAGLFRRLIFAVPLDDVHSPCRLHRLEKLLAIPLQSESSFLDTEIFAKATFLGHLIDEVEVPPLAQ